MAEEQGKRRGEALIGKINQAAYFQDQHFRKQPDAASKDFSWKSQLTLPNLLTLLRLLAIPYMAYILATEEQLWGKGLIWFLAIWFTDVLDGFIARHFNQISELGMLFDPAVDKLFHFATAVALCVAGRLPLWVPLFIAVKELAMSVGSMLILKREVVVRAHPVGKLATLLFVLSFVVSMLLPLDAVYWRQLIFVPPCLCSIWALLHYARFYCLNRKD